MDKITFEDLPSTNTPINSNNLNKMQTNIETAISTNEESINDIRTAMNNAIQPISLTIDTNYVYSSDWNYSCFKIGKMVILNIHSIAFISEMDNYVQFIYGLPKPVNYKTFYLMGGNGASGSTARCGLREDGSIQTHWGSPTQFGDSANKQYEGTIVYETYE